MSAASTTEISGSSLSAGMAAGFGQNAAMTVTGVPMTMTMGSDGGVMTTAMGLLPGLSIGSLISTSSGGHLVSVSSSPLSVALGAPSTLPLPSSSAPVAAAPSEAPVVLPPPPLPARTTAPAREMKRPGVVAAPVVMVVPAEPIDSSDAELWDAAVRDEWKCAICKSICRDVVEDPTCGQLFCQPCILRWLGQKPQCPACRAPLRASQLVHSANLRRKIEQRAIKCPACTAFTGPRAALDEHLQTCAERKWRCLPCGAVFARRDAERHRASECPQRPVACPHGCGAQVPFAQLEQHERETCPAAPATCPNEGCGLQGLTRATLAAHLERDCKHVRVVCVGCGQSVARDQLRAHLGEPALLGAHLAALFERLQTLQQAVDARSSSSAAAGPSGSSWSASSSSSASHAPYATSGYLPLATPPVSLLSRAPYQVGVPWQGRNGPHHRQPGVRLGASAMVPAMAASAAGPSLDGSLRRAGGPVDGTAVLSSLLMSLAEGAVSASGGRGGEGGARPHGGGHSGEFVVGSDSWTGADAVRVGDVIDALDVAGDADRHYLARVVGIDPGRDGASQFEVAMLGDDSHPTQTVGAAALAPAFSHSVLPLRYDRQPAAFARPAFRQMRHLLRFQQHPVDGHWFVQPHDQHRTGGWTCCLQSDRGAACLVAPF